MMKLAIPVAAAALALAALGGAAAASPVSPATAAAAAPLAQAPVENVTWVCRAGRCVWQPGARVWVPPYARGWGPPRRRGCFWTQVRGPYGGWRWVQVCR